MLQPQKLTQKSHQRRIKSSLLATKVHLPFKKTQQAFNLLFRWRGIVEDVRRFLVSNTHSYHHAVS